MWKFSHPQEEVDIWLISCFMKRKAWLLLAIAISGTLLFGSIYYLKYVVLGPRDSFGVSSMFYVGYSYLPYESHDFYGTADWSKWLLSEDVLNHLTRHMETISKERYSDNPIGFVPSEGDDMYLPTIAELSSYLSIQCPENYEMVTITVSTPDPLLSMAAALALNEIFPQLVLHNPDIEVETVRLVDFTEAVYKVIPDVRPLRAFLLGAVISFLFTPIGYLLYASGDSKIRIPSVFERRYGIPAFCYRTHDECLALVDHIYTNGALYAVKVGSTILDREVIDRLKPYITTLTAAHELPSLLGQTSDTHPANKDNSGDEVLLVLDAGTSREPELEETLRLLTEKGYRIRAALLWHTDPKLIANYYELQSNH
jgi:hypothetical protein